jgi:nitroreductase
MPPLSPAALLEALNWRYATQVFDPARAIPAETWNALEQALVLAPSSIGLQPWKFLIVTDRAVKTRLRAAAWNQAQPETCSHFVVFVLRQDLSADHVDRHVARISEVLSVEAESLGKFRKMTLGNLDKARAEGRLDTWQAHQLYIALGQFMAAAAVLGVDTCAMEGFQPEKFDEILGLTGTGFTSIVACAAGYRAADDKAALRKKVRFPASEVIQRL